MLVNCVTVYVKEEFIEEFIQETLANHQESIKEPGNLRFDVLQCVTDPSRFFLYEAYESEETSANHKKTAHYLKWKETVAPWMAKSREGLAHKVVAPKEKDLW